MWMLENRTPYGAERNWHVSKDGAKSWVVAVRATFDICPDGSTKLAEKQDPPLLLPEYRGEPGKSSMIYDCDLAGPKKGTDVMLNGHAYSPRGKPATETTTTLRVHTIDKSLQIVGDRRWEKGIMGPSLTAPEPFVNMPIVYERAFGGWDCASPDPKEQRIDPRNPVGTGVAANRDRLIGKVAANIEAIGKATAGFGAIDTSWSPRREFAGTFDDNWQKNRFPLWPQDFDEDFFRCVPPEQQIAGFLHGGEKVELLNLSPQGMLVFALPKVYLTFSTWFGRRSAEHRSNLHTVILEPDHPRVIMVWYTQLACHHQVDELDRTVINEKPYR